MVRRPHITYAHEHEKDLEELKKKRETQAS